MTLLCQKPLTIRSPSCSQQLLLMQKRCTWAKNKNKIIAFYFYLLIRRISLQDFDYEVVAGQLASSPTTSFICRQHNCSFALRFGFSIQRKEKSFSHTHFMRLLYALQIAFNICQLLKANRMGVASLVYFSKS